MYQDFDGQRESTLSEVSAGGERSLFYIILISESIENPNDLPVCREILTLHQYQTINIFYRSS